KALTPLSVSWSEDWPALDDDFPIIAIGNEFLDALPVRQFEVANGNWKERKIAVANDKLGFICEDIISSEHPANLPPASDCDEGSVFETNPAAEKIITQIATCIAEKGGSALFIDYGPMESGLGDSFQSVQNHQYTDPLESPGTSDLTAHVNFARLKDLASKLGCHTLPVSTQGRFLERLGIEARALTLSRNATEDQTTKISADLKRLISTEEMGTLFKAMTFYAKLTEAPAGFGE
ncbi:MAG: SAM-dependent methyltransferase, partial [Sneathiella sp.]|nr:SAM-dependent methyltransferase [Sneathiella sp.]